LGRRANWRSKEQEQGNDHSHILYERFGKVFIAFQRKQIKSIHQVFELMAEAGGNLLNVLEE